MQSLNLLQGAIHSLEAGLGVRFVRNLLFALLVILVLGVYDWRCYQNMSAPEAMDAAQLARNIARGRGFTTEFVRPFSIHLVGQKSTATSAKDPAGLNSGHPDIANAPVYPAVLAGLMHVLPFEYDANLAGNLWSVPDPYNPGMRRGTRFEPDFLIALFNQALFLVVIILAFFWTRKLFDEWVAWTSVVLLIGSEMLWHFTVSGLSTMLLMSILAGLVWCLTLLEREAREPKWTRAGLVGLSVIVGALTGLGGLTRYAFLWLIIPVLAFIILYGGKRRVVLSIVAFAVFATVMTPWLIRNHSLSGHFFGIRNYSLMEGWIPEFRLQRSLRLDPAGPPLRAYIAKLVTNLASILQTDIFKIGGGWISAFFVVGLMVPFRNIGLRRMRYFVVAGIAVLAVAQALGRTELSDETPEFNSENLLVLFAPAVLVFGVGMFYMLLDNIKFTPQSYGRHVMIGSFVAVLWLPMLFTIFSSKKYPVAYPPYRPAAIQNITQLLGKNELVMSDIPWAVAWYGDRQCIWLTLAATVDHNDEREWEESFFAVNDILKPVAALYLTPRSLDARFESQWMRGGESSWLNFVTEILLRKRVPPTFPLTQALPGYMPEQLALFDTKRWEMNSSTDSPVYRAVISGGASSP